MSLRSLLALTTVTILFPVGKGSGLNRTAFTSVNTVVLMPMPTASVATIAAENQGWPVMERQAARRSRMSGRTQGLGESFSPGSRRHGPPGLLNGLMKTEQARGVGGGVGEVERPALARLQSQVVDLDVERCEVSKGHRKTVLAIGG